MKYAAHPTLYKGVRFRSRLEARWAAFFDRVGWEWSYEPLDVQGWVPDFMVTFHCGHSDCPPKHRIFIEVKPYTTLEQFKGHVVDELMWDISEFPSPCCAIMPCGVDPTVTLLNMPHGAGGVCENIVDWIESRGDAVDAMYEWRLAGNDVQWRGQ